MQPLHCMVFLSEGCSALTEQDGPGRTPKESIKDRKRKKNKNERFQLFSLFILDGGRIVMFR